MPKPSDPKRRILFPFHSISVKFFLLFCIKTINPKIFSLKNFNVVFIFDTLKIFICSIHPLADLYINLLSSGKCLSLIIIPSNLNEAALLIIEPIFLGSVTSSKHANVKFVFIFNKFF